MPRPPLDLHTGTVTFYAAASLGGTVDVLHTVVMEAGFVSSWTVTAPPPPSGPPGTWDFTDVNNSAHALLMCMD